MAKKMKLGTQHRAMSVDRESINEKERTAMLSFSSEYPVERSYGMEVLDHSPGAADLSRLNNRGPVLLDHDTRDLIGVVESAGIKDKRGVATVRFSRSELGEQVLRDLIDGIRSNVSFGYRVKSMVLDTVRDGIETYRVTKYEPLEISMVSVPADPTVGVGRSYEVEIEEKETMKMNRTLLDPNPSDGGGAPNWDAERAALEAKVKGEHAIKIANLKKRDTEIDGLANLANLDSVRAIAAEFKADENRTVADFRTQILPLVLSKPTPLPVGAPAASEGMSNRDLKNYSFTRAIMSCVPREHGGTGGLSGIEKELSDEVAKRTKRSPQGFFIPNDVLHKRVLEVGTFTGAGALVQTTDAGQPLIELLRNQMAVVAMGATTLSGLVGDVNIPRQTGGGTASWLSESAALSRADQTVGQLALRPHRLAASTAFSKQLLAQSSQDVENFVRTDLMQVIAIARDLACIAGSGVSGQPVGITNTTGLATAATYTAAGTLNWDRAVDFEQNVETENALTANLGYLMSTAQKAKFKTTEKASSTGQFIWEPNNMVNGYKAMGTNQITSTAAGAVIFGNWSDLIVADWDGMDVVVDPYSLSLNGQVSIVITTLTDCGIRHPVSFCLNVA